MTTIKKKKTTTDLKNKIWNSMFFCTAYNALQLGPAYFQPLAILSLQANRTISVPLTNGVSLAQPVPSQGTTLGHSTAQPPLWRRPWSLWWAWLIHPWSLWWAWLTRPWSLWWGWLTRPWSLWWGWLTRPWSLWCGPGSPVPVTAFILVLL